MITILDLDNCISDDGWRRYHIRKRSVKGDERYHTYHSLSGFDSCRNRHLWIPRVPSQTDRIVIFTARPDAFRAVTEEWLVRNDVPVDDPGDVYMRSREDWRPGVEVKQDFLDELRDATSEPVRVAYDDRPEIVEMYRRNDVEAEVVAING